MQTFAAAEAEAIRARSEVPAENQEAVIAQQLAENWPQIVEAGAEAFGNVDHMVVLNGAQGIEEMLAKALTLGGSNVTTLRLHLRGFWLHFPDRAWDVAAANSACVTAFRP
ncbi:flotillin domain-containing protein [Microtetraspora malaysiensis]|uniref:Flotillin domain-containing protein n=1 Tax=Microtetraspora malaysiensis TaxID=161358 RepID=A0ABW6T4D7_9ACTN